MIKVAVLDDYQDVFKSYLKNSNYKNNFNFNIFNDPFNNETEMIEQLKDFEVLFVMRERTRISNEVIYELKKLKYIMTSGMRNKSIDLDAAKNRKIVVCGTEINSNPTAELAWTLILGLARNLR